MKKTVLFLAANLVAGYGLIAESLTNEDILKMMDAGLSADVIIMTIGAAEETDFDLSVDGLIELKAKQVDEDVIRKMLESANRESAPPPAPAPMQESAGDELFPDIPIQPDEVPITVGNTYFTRCNFHYEKGRHLTTNYSRGTMVPINTEVKVLSMGGDTLMLEIGGQVIKIDNVEDFSRRSLDQIASRMLSPTPIPLEQLGELTSGLITRGQLRLGMTKEQVLMARGYPPGHETLDVSSDRWIYWSSRFVKQTLLFSNGRLVEGRGIR